jgi:hypothetical protein
VGEPTASGRVPMSDQAWIDAIPAVDGHLHPPQRLPRPTDRDAFLRLFTESDAPAQLPHVAHTLYFQQALHALGALHGCPPEIDALLAARRVLSTEELLARSVGEANVRALLVDDGYRHADSYTLNELRAAVPADCQVWGVLRLETLVEQLAAQHADFGAFEEAFTDALHDLRARGYVALKSIAAYRCGLALGPPDRSAAAAHWPRLHALARAGPLSGACGARQQSPGSKACRCSSTRGSATATWTCCKPTRCCCAQHSSPARYAGCRWCCCTRTPMFARPATWRACIPRCTSI